MQEKEICPKSLSLLTLVGFHQLLVNVCTHIFPVTSTARSVQICINGLSVDYSKPILQDVDV